MRSTWAVAGLFLCATILCEGGLPSTCFAQHLPARFTGTLPLAFEANRGQAPAEIAYLAHAAEGVMRFSRDRVEIPCANGSEVALRVAGASSPTLRAESPTGGRVNYYPGSDRSKWIEGVPLEGRLRYEQISPGVDVLFHGQDGRLEYDVEVAPGAQFSSVAFEPSAGMSFAVQPDGSAELKVGAGSHCGAAGIQLLAPVAYQEIEGRRQEIRAAFRVDERGRLGFVVPQYDHSRVLTIDPVVAYTKMIDVNNNTSIKALQVDASGDVFIAGGTSATNFPVVNGTSYTGLNDQVYVAELDPTGTNVLFSTYFPAGDFSYASALAVDAAGNIYVAGVATIANIPMTSQNLGVCSTFCNTGFAVKFSSSGTLVYSTMLGTEQQLPKAVAVDAGGNLYIAGSTDTGLQAVNGYQTAPSGGAFFGKLNPTGTAWVFSSYFWAPGGANETYATGVTLDTAGDIYITGVGTDVPLRNPLQIGVGDGFVAEFGPDGKSLLFSTLIGGTDITAGSGFGVQVGKDGTIYVAGSEADQDFPYTPAAFAHPTYPTGYTGIEYMFAAGINPAHTAFSYSGYLGQGWVNATAMDSQGNFYIAGSANAGTIPLKNAVAADVVNSGFVVELDPLGNVLMGTALGGHNSTQVPNAMAVDGSGNIYVGGTPGTTIPNTSAGGLQDPINVGTGAAYTQQLPLGTVTANYGYSTFIAKIAPANQPQISLSYRGPVLELRDAGSADLHISGIQLSSGQANSTCGATVAAGTSCFLTPTDSAGDTVSTTITINSDAQPGSQAFTPYWPANANPTGLKVPGTLYYDTTQLYFPPQANGTTSTPHPLKIWNVGATSVVINNVLTFGYFQQTNNCGTLAPQTYCTAEITVSPVSTSTGGGSNIVDIGIVHDTNFRDDAYARFTQNPIDGPLLLSASSVGFGSELLNQQSVIHTITVTNSSNSPVSVGDPTLGGSNTASFAVQGNTCSGVMLQPQASCVVSVTFQPAAAGYLYTPLTIAAGGVTDSVSLTGTGVTAPSVAITPGSFNFNGVFLGQTAQQVFTVQNNGTASATVANVVAAMADATASADYAEQNTCQGALAAGATCTVTVTVAPQTTGARNGTLSMTVNGGITTLTASLGATGVFPVSASPSAVSFGQVPDGTTSSQTITLTNATAVSQSVTVTTGAPFQIASNNCGTMSPGGQCSVSVNFSPQTSGLQTGPVTVAVAGIPATLGIAASGTGTAPIASLSSSSVSFGNQTVGVASSAQTVTLTNSGNALLSGIALAVNGTNAGDFTTSGNCGSTLAPGASCSIGVVFKPSSTAGESASLSVASNAAASPQVVQLAGTGVPPDFAPTAAAASAAVSGGGTASYSLSFPSTMTGTVSLACNGLPLYAACSFSPATVTLSTTTAASSTLSVTTTATQTAALSRRELPGIAIAGLMLLCSSLGRRRRITRALLSLAGVAVMLCGMTGCSGSSSGGSTSGPHTVAPGSYAINVVATSGTVSHSLALTLNVQ